MCGQRCSFKQIHPEHSDCHMESILPKNIEDINNVFCSIKQQ